MINLLPVSYKEDISYARRNTFLRTWIIWCALALAGVGVIVAGGMLYLQHSIGQYNKQITLAEDQLKAQKLTETQAQVESISADTKLALQVLSREVLFSKLLRQISSTLPNNTALKSLQIDQLQGGLTLNAGATDFNAATQMQVNLQDAVNGVFEKADINNISCTDPPAETTEPASKYRCSVEVKALFNKNKSYMYITPTTQGNNKQ